MPTFPLARLPGGLRESWRSPHTRAILEIFIAGGIVAAILSIIPRLFVWYRRRTRLVQINGGLADMLDMLSMCLGGGMSISASLEHVSKSHELSGPRRRTLDHAAAVRCRQPAHALVDFANRIDTPEVRQVSTLLARGEALGTSLSGSLLDQADHFRTARKQLATLQANRMPVLLTFPLLFCFAPAVLIVLMSPAFLQISEFLNPQNGDNPLANNGTINTQRIVNTLNGLDQDVSAANRSPLGRSSPAVAKNNTASLRLAEPQATSRSAVKQGWAIPPTHSPTDETNPWPACHSPPGFFVSAVPWPIGQRFHRTGRIEPCESGPGLRYPQATTQPAEAKHPYDVVKTQARFWRCT
jgi:hypothetical protein